MPISHLPSPMPPQAASYTESEWRAEGRARFGPDTRAWRFVCHGCGNIQCDADFVGLVPPGTSGGIAAQMCLGQYLPVADARQRGLCVFGALDNLRRPVELILDHGRTLRIFDFAEVGQ